VTDFVYVLLLLLLLLILRADLLARCQCLIQPMSDGSGHQVIKTGLSGSDHGQRFRHELSSLSFRFSNTALLNLLPSNLNWSELNSRRC